MSPKHLQTIARSRWCAAFSNAALLLARALASPREFTGDDPDMLDSLDLTAWPTLDAARLSWLREWRSILGASDREQALLAYARLFLGPFDVQVIPYASHYLDPQKRLMGETSQWVAEFYAECDLIPPEDRPTDAPDHLALECEFLYFLGFQLISSGEPLWAERITRFLDDHFLRWVPLCAYSIAAADTSPFYKALATFLTEWCEQIHAANS